MARKKGQISKFFVGILLVMLMVGLAGFGVTNFGGRIRSVGEVGTVEIGVNQYAQALNVELRNLQQNIGQNISLEQARQFGLDAQVMGRLIATAALANETSRIGLSVGDGEVQRQLLATQGFRGLDGQFDRNAYEFGLERNNLTPKEYEVQIRSQTAGSILQNAVSSGVSAPSTYSDIIVAYLGERRSFSWLEINAGSLENPVSEPNNADLRAYFDANPATYVLPASKRLTYAWLSPEFVMDQIDVSEDELRAIYDARSSEFNTPERRLVERLVFANMADAETARTSIAAGTASLDGAVITRGLTLADIDLGDVTRASLGSAGDAVFSLVQPGLTDAVETDLGPAILRVNAILSARTVSFADARGGLLNEVAADNARRLVADQTAELDDLLAGGATLEELADETDMQLSQLDWVQGDSDGIAAYAAFSNAAQLATQDDFPAIETLADGGVFALRLDDLIDERPDSFENAQAQVAIDWAASALNDALKAETDALLANLGSGASLSSLGLPVAVETNAKRDSVYLGKPPGFLEAIFELETGTATSVTSATAAIIIQLNSVSGADPHDPDRAALHQAIMDDTAQSIGQDALSAFSNALQQEAGISLNQTAIAAVHAQFSGTGGGFVPTNNQGGMGGGHN